MAEFMQRDGGGQHESRRQTGRKRTEIKNKQKQEKKEREIHIDGNPEGVKELVSRVQHSLNYTIIFIRFAEETDAARRRRRCRAPIAPAGRTVSRT
jgi:hypothetical protein